MAATGLGEILGEIRERADAAAEGPWTTMSYGGEGSDIHDADGDLVAAISDEGNATFIADARTTVPRLTDALLAVLALHVRSEATARGVLFCEECAVGDFTDTYPCPTVTAITAALTPAEVEL